MNRFEAERRFVQRMKDNYPPGTRIMLLQMGDDPRPIEPNTKGTVQTIDDIGTLTIHYYCPLQIHMTDEEYGDWYEVDSSYGIAYEDAIHELVKHEQDRDLHNMADYFDGSAGAKAKLVSAVWDVQEVCGELYGVIRTGIREAFSPEEEKEWIDELIGQAADGFGEGLEQREIKTDIRERLNQICSDKIDIVASRSVFAPKGRDMTSGNRSRKAKEFLRNWKKDYSFKTAVSAFVSMGFTILFALYNGYLGPSLLSISVAMLIQGLKKKVN